MAVLRLFQGIIGQILVYYKVFCYPCYANRKYSPDPFDRFSDRIAGNRTTIAEDAPSLLRLLFIFIEQYEKVLTEI